MKRASMIVIHSKQCREASTKHYPIDADELFNITWLKLREVEIEKPDWRPDNAVRYFLVMLKNEALSIKKDLNKRIPWDEKISPIEVQKDERIEREILLLKWVNSPSKNDEELFYKNIITLAIYSKDINDACKNADIKRNAFWKYRKQAIKKFYEDTDYNADIDIDFGADLV